MLVNVWPEGGKIVCSGAAGCVTGAGTGSGEGLGEVQPASASTMTSNVAISQL
ncbi:MAG: hypothetical protein ACE5LA_03670 [Dehalococcoidales bacterium]